VKTNIPLFTIQTLETYSEFKIYGKSILFCIKLCNYYFSFYYHLKETKNEKTSYENYDEHFQRRNTKKLSRERKKERERREEKEGRNEGVPARVSLFIRALQLGHSRDSIFPRTEESHNETGPSLIGSFRPIKNEVLLES